MSLIWLLYLANVAENLSQILGFFGLLLAIGTAIYSAIQLADYKKNKIGKTGLIISGVLLVLASIIPSKKTIYMMAAANYGQEIAASPEAQQLKLKVLELLNAKLDTAITEVHK